MREILGNKLQHYIQTNNAQVELFKDYFDRGKPIACGPTAAAMGFDIAGWPMNVFTPGEQPEDSILMIAHNPANLEKIKNRRNLNYDRWPPNEIPQVYDVVGELIYRTKACRYMEGLSFEIVKENISKKTPMMVASGKFPCGAHYVLIVGFDDEKEVVIFNDPYPPQWPDKQGYNREMNMDFFKTLGNWRVDFLPFKIAV
ncbi:MAG: C39 family peptidase [Spirochaetales bacterium]|nr:C39 family peptidase [Spirochaetales bacterium]